MPCMPAAGRRSLRVRGPDPGRSRYRPRGRSNAVAAGRDVSCGGAVIYSSKARSKVTGDRSELAAKIAGRVLVSEARTTDQMTNLHATLAPSGAGGRLASDPAH